ncbi:protein translocase subunit SecF [Candidatus Marinamargulisbacteria bacterium SCGC AG-439-L15]|nr:protein translocase subunit SecF [Candidatus Marinamargulisbacteria bacterium SCGC AG-439-L15]
MIPDKLVTVVQKRNLWFLISFLVISIGIGLMSYRSLVQQPFLNFGIDFTGGASFLVKFDSLNQSHASQKTIKSSSDINTAFIKNLRGVLKSVGLDKSQIQITQDKEVIIRTIHLKNDMRINLLNLLEERLGVFELLEVDIIGPSIGEELKKQSFWIILLVSISLLIYISWRFDILFGGAALMAVLHDALVVLSLAAMLKIEVNTAFVAAILTILGYSINDTIVIFDRIRENLALYEDKQELKAIINISITQMLSRSLHTSVTTLSVIGALLIFGGVTIKSFALILLIGIIAGTYSSIFIASPILYVLSLRKAGKT